MKKNILFVMSILGGGGAERVITHLANAMDRTQFSPTLLLVMDAKHDYLENLKNDIKVVQMNRKCRLRYLPFKILKAIKKQNPDIVLMGLGELNLLLAPFIPFYKKPKWVARETNTLDIRIGNSFLKKFLYKKFYKNYDYFFAESKDMRDDLAHFTGIPLEKINLIKNPFDTFFVDEKLKEKCTVKLPENKINLLACGRFTYQKGFDNLLKSFAKIKNKEQYHLTILGEGQKKDSENQESLMHEIIKKNGLEKNVSLPGFQKNIYHWLQKADYFILSSRYEGLPNILLEALYCGTPALVNHCRGGIDEVILEGKNGILFDFKKENFEEKLVAIQKISFQSKALYEDIKNRFSVEKIIKKYEAIL